MIVFKCKMCGGDVEPNPDRTVGTCQYCGSAMTLPKQADEQKANQFNRANHFRRANQFDKAAGIYDMILNHDNTDAEAHWGAVLCRYGIEYVEDPATHKRLPTCHRTLVSSVLTDEDYKLALQYADYDARALYEEEAQKIDEIQKEILEISRKEDPFDVFICYKETDDTGARTPDSVLAQEIYYELTEQGYHVFFSRITLEDKLGTAYEPYIFAALNSSKVMLVLGTKPEYFEAVWVRNEWARYLALIQNGAKKLLIPAYKDMDPYDLPDEFSHLQAQDMSKIGFMQDLVRGIQKTISEPDVPVSSSSPSLSDVQALVKRGYLFLEDSDFDMANIYFNKALDRDPEYSEAYWGLLLVSRNCVNEQALLLQENLLDEDKNFEKAVRFSHDPENKYTLFNRQLRQKQQEKIDALQQKINLLENEIASNAAYIKELQQKINAASERKTTLETQTNSTQFQLVMDEKYEQLSQKKILLQNELKSLSIFSVVRKKEIRDSISKIHNAMSALIQTSSQRKKQLLEELQKDPEMEQLNQQLYNWTTEVEQTLSKTDKKMKHLSDLKSQLELFKNKAALSG